MAILNSEGWQGVLRSKKKLRERSTRKAYIKASGFNTVRQQHNEAVKSMDSGDRLPGFHLGQLLNLSLSQSPHP